LPALASTTLRLIWRATAFCSSIAAATLPEI